MSNIDTRKTAEADYAELKLNFANLEFVNNVAIYIDNNATNRRIFETNASFDIWIEDYCNKHSIPKEKFRTYAYKISSMISECFKTKHKNFEGIQLSEDLFEELKSIKEWNGAGEPYSYHTCIRLITGFNQIQNNYSLVTSDEWFLMDKHFMRMSRWYSDIELNEYGLFKLSKRAISYDNCYPGSITEYSTNDLLFDSEGNYTDEWSLKRILDILSNRKKCYLPQDYFKMIPEIEEGSFKTIGNKSNYYYQKEGKELEFEKEREDGLTFYMEESESNSGNSIFTECVRDNFGNSTSVDHMYKSLKMLENGRKYVNQLANNYLSEHTGKLTTANSKA